jgi:caffeoyl-CoA O-methyltransferase
VAREPKSFFLGAEIADYIVRHSTPPDEAQRWLIDETRARFGDVAMMQISPEQGAFMQLLTSAIGARRAIEIGTFTGYSSLCLALGLRDGGRLLCCDVSEEFTAVAREAWTRGGVEDRIELRIGPAIETLRALPADDDPIDLAFIDADKPAYAAYFEELLPRLRVDGLILVDNTLWMGAVVDDGAQDEDTVAIRAFNDLVSGDPRVETAMLPLGDGVTVLRKR